MWWLLAGCWNVQEEARHRRVWEMQDHEEDLYVARDALRRGDLAGARSAGERLAAKDPVPGLAEGAAPILERLRAGGERLAAASTAAEAADRLTAMTADCAACHRLSGVSAPQGSLAGRPEDLVWLGVAFEDEALWASGATALGALPPEPRTWEQRRSDLSAGMVTR